MTKIKQMLSRLGLAAGTLSAVIVGAAAFSAYEAHVVNVTATISEATEISTSALTFGTVFPQEILHMPVTLSLSSSFSTSTAVGVDYMIKQKPKCGLPVETASGTPVSYSAYGQVTEDEAGVFSCVDAGYVKLPLLCPYLSKTSPDVGDISVPSFHGTTTLAGWTDAVSVATKAVGHLTQQDPSTTWDIDLHVPCFKGQCAQDWASYVNTANPAADPVAYMADPSLEHQQMGCDLWYELTNVNRPTPSPTPTPTPIN